jgi:hypothetical protein
VTEEPSVPKVPVEYQVVCKVMKDDPSSGGGETFAIFESGDGRVLLQAPLDPDGPVFHFGKTYVVTIGSGPEDG